MSIMCQTIHLCAEYIYREIYHDIVHIANGGQQTYNVNQIDHFINLNGWDHSQTKLYHSIKLDKNVCFKINMSYDRDRFICVSSSSYSGFRRTVLSQ